MKITKCVIFFFPSQRLKMLMADPKTVPPTYQRDAARHTLPDIFYSWLIAAKKKRYRRFHSVL